MADKTDYVDEQDYSLNAGRYVGVEIEDDNITEEEFELKISSKLNSFKRLNKESHILENSILNNFNKI